MINKIIEIKKLGVFKDFKWGRDINLQEFSEKNIIYGWNYSGKTTFSRIFASLRDKKLHFDYSDCTFLLDTPEGNFDSKDINTNSFKVLVFNKEYIEENLNWNSNDKLSEPIAFDVGENVSIRKEITTLEEISKGLEKRKDKYEKIVKEFEEYETSYFTKESKNIRTQISNNTVNFDKYNFKKILATLDSKDLDSYIESDSDKIETLRKSSVSINSYDVLTILELNLSFEELKKNVGLILKEEPPKDVIINILENNKNLYNWVKEGIEFEENKTVCSFCGNSIENERLTVLNNYFSNASKILRDKIDSSKLSIKKEIEKIDKFSIPFTKRDFIDKIQNNVDVKIKELSALKSEYNNSLNILMEELVRKEDKNIFNPLTIIKIDDSSPKILEWVKDINTLVKEHNDFISDFDVEKEKAREKLKHHLIAEYLKKEKYFEKAKTSKKATEVINAFNKYILKIDNQKNLKLNSLKKITIGKKNLNDFIRRFLNRDDIKIDVTSDDKFILLRGKYPARNLSEGEKTAIAFSYFMVFFESLGIEEMKKYIIFIDDPISSLDSNHIAQVYSLINSFFFRKTDLTDPEKIINCFNQLFISTHNFELFSFIKDSKRLGSRSKKSKYYHIQKISAEESTLKNLPLTLLKYKSEYIYLFELLYGYYNKVIKGDNDIDILIPNALRRFLEIYTLMKIPNKPNSVEDRIRELVDDVNQFKILHHFSHFTSFEKATRHDELIMVLPDAIKEWHTLLNNDKKHLNSLISSIGLE